MEDAGGTSSEGGRRSYGLNEVVVLRGEDGTAVKGVVTEPLNEDGFVTVEMERGTIDGRRVLYLTPEELDEMAVDGAGAGEGADPAPTENRRVPDGMTADRTISVAQKDGSTREYTVAKDQAGKQYVVDESGFMWGHDGNGENMKPYRPGENVSEWTDEQIARLSQPTQPSDAASEAPAAPAAVEQPAEPTGEPMPIDKEGEPQFMQVTPERGHAYIFGESGLDRSKGRQFVKNNIDAAKTNLDKLKKKEPTIGTSIAKYNKQKAEWQQKLAEAQQALDYWNTVNEHQQRIEAAEAAERSAREAEARKAAAERAAAEAAERAAREEAERIEREALNGVPEWHQDTPENARKRGFRRYNGQKWERQEPLPADIPGKETVVAFSNKAEDLVKGRRVIVDLAKHPVQPSHIQGERNPLFFIEEGQPKNRTDDVSKMTERTIAENIRPKEITLGETGYVGEPKVNNRLEVVQGNNRMGALLYLWDNNLPEQQKKYREYLQSIADEYATTPENVAAMEKPVAITVLDVDDAEAIRLGQLTAQDTESGGIERIKAKNVAQKLGDNMRQFANMLLRSEDEEASFGQLVDRNGVEVLKWMNQTGVITPTQYQSAFDSKGNLTAEAKNDLSKVLYQAVFKGANQQLEELFDKLPAKAQRAILSTAFRDLESPFSQKMLGEIQASIRAYTELMSNPSFANAKKLSEVLGAVEAWAQQTALDDRFETVVPADNYSNFALRLAAMYKASDYSQKTIATTFNDMYDLIQGTVKPDLFNPEPDTTPRTLAEAIKEKLGIDYQPAKNDIDNGRNGSTDVALDHQPSQAGERGSSEPPASGEPAPEGEEPADGGGRATTDSPAVTEQPAEVGLTDGKKFDKGTDSPDGLMHEASPITSETTPGNLDSDGKGSDFAKDKQGGGAKSSLHPRVVEELQKYDISNHRIEETARLKALDRREMQASVESMTDDDLSSLREVVQMVETFEGELGLPYEEREGTILLGAVIEQEWGDRERRAKNWKKGRRGADTISGEGYSIAPKPYTNKQGKTLDTYLVTFDRDFSKEEMSALRAKAKAVKGWYDREAKGWMLRSAEDAKAFAEDVMSKSEDEVADEAPLSLKETRGADVENDKPLTQAEQAQINQDAFLNVVTSIKDAIDKGGIPNIKAIKKEIAKRKRQLTTLENGAATGITDNATLRKHQAAIAKLEGEIDGFQASLDAINKRIKESESADYKTSKEIQRRAERYEALRQRMKAKLGGESNKVEEEAAEYGHKKSQSKNRQDLTTRSKELLAPSTIDDANIQKISENLSHLSEKYHGLTSSHGVLTDLANAIGAKGKDVSKYAHLTLVDGKEVEIRISNHNANAATFGERGRNEGNLSIVIKSRRSWNTFKGHSEVELTEYVYTTEAIAKDGNLLSGIAESLQGLIKNGEYVDLTGKAIVNRSPEVVEKIVNEGQAEYEELKEGIRSKLYGVNLREDTAHGKKDDSGHTGDYSHLGKEEKRNAVSTAISKRLWGLPEGTEVAIIGNIEDIDAASKRLGLSGYTAEQLKRLYNGGKTNGAYNRESGIIFIFADKARSEGRLDTTLLHETIHRQLDAMADGGAIVKLLYGSLSDALKKEARAMRLKILKRNPLMLLTPRYQKEEAVLGMLTRYKNDGRLREMLSGMNEGGRNKFEQLIKECGYEIVDGDEPRRHGGSEGGNNGNGSSGREGGDSGLSGGAIRVSSAAEGYREDGAGGTHVGQRASSTGGRGRGGRLVWDTGRDSAATYGIDADKDSGGRGTQASIGDRGETSRTGRRGLTLRENTDIAGKEEADNGIVGRSVVSEGEGASYGVKLDGEMLQIGIEMTEMLIEDGVYGFKDYCDRMISDIGDEIRPYLKKLYGTVLAEGGSYSERMSRLDDVRSFDVYNYDNQGAVDLLGTAKHVTEEEAIEKGFDSAMIEEDAKVERRKEMSARLEEMSLDEERDEVTPQDVNHAVGELQSMWEELANVYGEEPTQPEASELMEMVERAISRWRKKDVTVVEGSAVASIAAEGKIEQGEESNRTARSNQTNRMEDSNRSATGIQDWGEKIEGARKDALGKIAKKMANITAADLVANPLSKVFKAPDWRKSVENGELTEDDARLLEAISQLILRDGKPRLSSSRSSYKRKRAEAVVEQWAQRVARYIDGLRRIAAAESKEERESIIAEIGNIDRVDEAEHRKKLIEWNPGRVDGGRYTPNEINVMIDVLIGMGYPSNGIGKAKMASIGTDSFGGSYEVRLDGKYHGRYTDYEDAVKAAINIGKTTRGDRDIEYGKDDFRVKIVSSDKEATGKWTVYTLNGVKVKEGLTEEEAQKEANLLNIGKKSNHVALQEYRYINKYGVAVRDHGYGEVHLIDSTPEFESQADARGWIDENIESLQEMANGTVSAYYLPKGSRGESHLAVEIDYNYGTKTYNVWIPLSKRESTPFGNMMVLASGFKSRKEAQTWIADNQADLDAWDKARKEARRKFVFFNPEKPRRGADYRGGRDISEAELGETFGFRGVQFGNWTNQRDRQNSVNEAYDALMDMSNVLGLSPRAIGLGGELGIAFGARGSGSANAHYEPTEVVINLTKTRGAGSLAHEWWHALDNYFARRGGITTGMITNGIAAKIREEVRGRFIDIVKAINSSDYAKRSIERGASYWGTPVEMTARLFAEWIDMLLGDKKSHNSFLSRGIDGSVVEGHKKMMYEEYKYITNLNNAQIEKENADTPEAERKPLNRLMSYEEFKDTKESLRGFPYPLKEEIRELFDAPMGRLFETIEEKVNGKQTELNEPAAEYGVSERRSRYKGEGMKSLFDLDESTESKDEGPKTNEGRYDKFAKLSDVEKADELEAIIGRHEKTMLELEDKRGTSEEGREMQRVLCSLDELWQQMTAMYGEQPTDEAAAKAIASLESDIRHIRLALLAEARQELAERGEADQEVYVTATGETISYKSMADNDPMLETRREKLKAQDGEFCHTERIMRRLKKGKGGFGITGMPTIKGAQDVAYMTRFLETASNEHVFAVMVKDGKGVVMHIGYGNDAASTVDLKAFKVGCDRLQPDEVYIVHNHPSGNMSPSVQDDALIKSASGIFGKEVKGIIMDTWRRTFVEFGAGDTKVSERDMSLDGSTEIAEYSMGGVDSTVYNKEHDDKVTQILDSDDAAKYIYKWRLGSNGKVGYFVQNRNGETTANISTAATDLTMENATAICEEAVKNAVVFGGSGIIFYGTMPEGLTYQVWQKMQGVVQKYGLRLNDAIQVGGRANMHHSYNDRGEIPAKVSEPDFRLGDQAETPDTRSAEAKRGEAERIGELLHTPVRIIENVEDITDADAAKQAKMRRAKGWYDPRTGEVVINLSRNRNVGDVTATMLHEVVAHKGLREVFGEDFDTFLDNVFANVTLDIRKKIVELAQKNGWDIRTATEEYLASLAETTNFEEAERQTWFVKVWNAIKDAFMEMLSKKGIKLPRRIRENELRYMLWRTYQMQVRGDLVGEAENVVMQQELGVGRFSELEQHGLDEVNRRFNEELERYIKGRFAANEIFHLGNPSGALLHFLPELPIVMRQRIMTKGSSKKHNVALESLSNLPQKISEPIFVFDRGDGSIGILTEIKDRDGNNVCVAIEMSREIRDGGAVLAVNDIRSIHGREVKNIVSPIINNGTLRWVDKDKGLEWLSSASQQAQQEIAQTDLEDAAKVIENFENPKIETEGDAIKFRDGDPTPRDRANARDRYEQRVKSGWYQTREALQDSMLGLKEAMDAILRAEGKKKYIEDIDGFENAYLGENRLSSTNQAEADAMGRLLFKPLIATIAKIAKGKRGRNRLTEYMMAITCSCASRILLSSSILSISFILPYFLISAVCLSA